MKLEVKERVLKYWGTIALFLGHWFSFTNEVPMLGSSVALPYQVIFGVAVGLCVSATFFLMGYPVIEAVFEAQIG